MKLSSIKTMSKIQNFLLKIYTKKCSKNLSVEKLKNANIRNIEMETEQKISDRSQP